MDVNTIVTLIVGTTGGGLFALLTRLFSDRRTAKISDQEALNARLSEENIRASKRADDAERRADAADEEARGYRRERDAAEDMAARYRRQLIQLTGEAPE